MPGAAGAPERWSADAGARGVARLDIPADAQRERSFEVDCRLVVRASQAGARHGMRVLVDGALEWARTVATHPDGDDSLDLRLYRSVPVGRPLRLTATCDLHGAQRVSLRISAEEVRGD
jgi:hypothetical protein